MIIYLNKLTKNPTSRASWSSISGGMDILIHWCQSYCGVRLGFWGFGEKRGFFLRSFHAPRVRLLQEL